MYKEPGNLCKVQKCGSWEIRIMLNLFFSFLYDRVDVVDLACHTFFWLLINYGMSSNTLCCNL